MQQHHRMLCDKIIATRIQRNLCDPRISVVFDPFRTARSSDIPHKRLNRLDLSFGHSVFSLLMVNSKGGSSSILIVFRGMKSTSKFPTLRSKAIFGCSIPFSKICLFGLHWCSMAITYSQRFQRSRLVGDCEILFATTSWNFSCPFHPCFQIFREHVIVYPNKAYM